MVISVVAALGLQFFSGSALPLLLGSISEQLGFGAEQIGLLSACELAAIAVFAIGLTPVVARRSRVAFAALGTAISFVGHAIGVPAESFTWLVVSRLVAGAGIGMAAAAAQAAIAASSQPDRIFALFFAVSTLGVQSPRANGDRLPDRSDSGLRGQVLWHGSDGLDGTVHGRPKGPDSGAQVSLGVVRCHLGGTEDAQYVLDSVIDHVRVMPRVGRYPGAVREALL